MLKPKPQHNFGRFCLGIPGSNPRLSLSLSLTEQGAIDSQSSHDPIRDQTVARELESPLFRLAWERFLGRG